MLNACPEAHALAPLRFARAVEMWYFGSLSLGNNLFLIPLGIRLNFCQKLTQNELEIIVFSPFLDHCLTFFAFFLPISDKFLTYLSTFSASF